MHKEKRLIAGKLAEGLSGFLAVFSKGLDWFGKWQTFIQIINIPIPGPAMLIIAVCLFIGGILLINQHEKEEIPVIYDRHSRPIKNRKVTKIVLTYLLIGVLFAGVSIFIIVKYLPEVKTDDNEKISIFIDCENNRLPIKTPSDGAIWIINLYPFQLENSTGGIMHQPHPPGEELQLGVDPMDLTKARCELVNYGPSTVFNVSMELEVVFREAVFKETPTGKGFHNGRVILDRPWSIVIPKIDPGVPNAFIFYIYNGNKLFVNVYPPKTAQFQLVGEDKTRTVNVTFSKRFVNPQGMLTFFPPSKTMAAPPILQMEPPRKK